MLLEYYNHLVIRCKWLISYFVDPCPIRPLLIIFDIDLYLLVQNWVKQQSDGHQRFDVWIQRVLSQHIRGNIELIRNACIVICKTLKRHALSLVCIWSIKYCQWPCIDIDPDFHQLFVPMGPIDNNPTWIHIMAWRRICDKPSSEPKPDQLMDIGGTRGRWVNHWPLCREFTGPVTRKMFPFGDVIISHDILKSIAWEINPTLMHMFTLWLIW